MLFQRLHFAGRRARELQISEESTFEETFEWIWKSPFKYWLEGSNVTPKGPPHRNPSAAFGGDRTAESIPPFWVRGKPASGKSALINYLAKSNTIQERLTHRFQKHCVVIQFFFDFRETYNLRNNFKGLLLAFPYCLAQKIPQLGPQIKQSEWQDVVHYHEWPAPELQRIVTQSIKKCCDSDIMCTFVDGLDEYDGNMLELAHFLRNLSFTKNVISCIASYPHETLDVIFEGVPNLEMQKRNSDGLRNFVSLTLQRVKIIPSMESQNQHTQEAENARAIVGAIAQRAEGVFLWARFAMNELPFKWFRAEHDIDSLLRSLERLPPKLEDIWIQVFKRLVPEEKEEAAILMQLVCFAEEELTLEELLGAMQQVLKRPEAFMVLLPTKRRCY